MKIARGFLVLLMLIFVLPVTTYAHPGRTDSSGGHTNHSTGEYHYHHGYPEHDHWDMDQDGDLDCPYLFDDKTGSGSGSQNNTPTEKDSPEYFIDENGVVHDYRDKFSESQKQPEKSNNDDEEESSPLLDLLGFIGVSCLGIIICMWFDHKSSSASRW